MTLFQTLAPFQAGVSRTRSSSDTLQDPVIDTNPYVWFVNNDRDPTASEPYIDNIGISIDPNWLFPWWNKSTQDLFMCLDSTTSTMVWVKCLTDNNLPLSIANGINGVFNAGTARAGLGFAVGSSRDYSLQTLAASTPRTPNATNDTLVIITILQDSTSVPACEADIQVNTSGSYYTVASMMLSTPAKQTQTISFIVPLNASYQWLNTTGPNTLISIYEIAL